MRDGVELQKRILVAICEVKSEVAARRFQLSARNLTNCLRSKHRPDQPRAPKGTPQGGQWIIDPTSARQQNLQGNRQSVAWLPAGFTRHAIERAIGRGVAPALIWDALNNPLDVIPGTTANSWKYVGRGAVVVVNPFGKIITVWPQKI